MIATSFPASTKDSARRGLRSCALVGRLREIAKHAKVDGKTVARLRDDDEMAPRDHCSLRPSADVAARGFRAGKRASRGAYSGDDQRNADDSSIRMPKCGIAYQTTQQQQPDEHSGSFKCQNCQTEVHVWSGVFGFIDWKVYEAVGSTPKPWHNQTEHHPSPLLPHGRVN